MHLKTEKTQRNLLKVAIAKSKVGGDMSVTSCSAEMKSTRKDITDGTSIRLETIHGLSMERRLRTLSTPSVNPKFKKKKKKKKKTGLERYSDHWCAF